MMYEEVQKWLIAICTGCLWLIGCGAAILVIGFGSGYAIEKYDQSNPRCINSLCEYPCKEGARFVKNQGCLR